MNGKVTNCYIEVKKPGDVILRTVKAESGEIFLVPDLDGYAIVPREKYEALSQQVTEPTSLGR